MPVVDVEGAALHRKIAFSDWESAHGETTLLARDLVVREATPPTHVVAAPGRVTTVRVPEGVHPGELGQVLAGRRQPFDGEVVVDGLLLPEQREQVARRTALLEIGPFETAPVSPRGLFRDRARLTSVERFATQGVRRHRARRCSTTWVAAADARVEAVAVDASMALAGGADVYVMSGLDHLLDGPRRDAEALAAELADRGQTVIVVEPRWAPADPASTDGATRALEGSARRSHA